nr:DNA internalization-related competence protein ComEC/Rec2 [Marinobacter sp.]
MSRNTQFSTKTERSLLSPAGVFAFSCGVILLYRFSVLPPYPWLFLSLIILPPLLTHKSLRFSAAFLWLIWAAVGLGWAAGHADSRLQQKLPSVDEGVPLIVSGYVCDVPQPGSFNSLRFNFCVDSWSGVTDVLDDGALPDKIRLAWYGSGDKVPPLRTTSLKVVLKRPHGNLNNEGFRYEDWLFRQGVRATGSVRAVVETPDSVCGFGCLYRTWHREMASAVEQYFGTAKHYSLVASLLIGNRGHLSAEQWQTLKATGTIHLVAISGLHLGLVALVVGLISRRLLLLLPVGRISENFIRNTVYGVVLVACLFYALLAGMTVPTRRALVMVVVGGWFLLKAREVSPWRPFVVALGGVLLLDPFAPLDQGFWLSFFAVALLILVFSGRVGRLGWVAGLILAQGVVFAGLWPVLNAFDQAQPLAGVLANLFAIPWVSFVVMPALFAGTLLMIGSGGRLAGYVVDGFDAVLGVLWQLLRGVEALPAYSMPAASQGLLVALALVSLLALRFPDWRFRAFSAVVVVGWVGSSLWTDAEPINSSVAVPEVRIWDVGQGLSALVRSGSQVLMYDTGPEVKGVYSAMESVVLPNLKALGVKHIHHLVVSHGDSDHSGGLSVLLEELSIGMFSTGEPKGVRPKLEHHSGAMIQDCPRSIRTLGEFELSFWRSRSEHSGNDASCVLRVFHPKSGVDLLLTGDISRKVESEMLADPALDWLSAFSGRRLVVAPHHGSKTSSSMPWVSAAEPNWVIFTAGYRHRYRHPHQDVVRRYGQVGAVALNTACSGQLTISFERDGPRIVETKHQGPFWIAGPGLARDQCKIP